MPDTSVRKISMRVDPQMDAQLAELQAALNVDMSAVIRMAVAMMYRQAQENRWLSPLPETPAAAE
jgi:post-segregation antitoxin (ccd killing protein)